MGKICWDTSPFFQSVLTSLCDTPSPPINILTIMWYSLLLSLASATCTSTLLSGEGVQMMKFVFLDLHFEIEEELSQDPKCPNNFVQGCGQAAIV